MIEDGQSPLDRAIFRARKSVLSNQEILEAAGVSAKQIAKAADIAEERVRQEFEESRKQDPLRVVALVLRSSVITPQELALVAVFYKHLEATRSHWQHYLQIARKQLNEKGIFNPDFMEILEHLKTNTLQAPEARRGNGLDWELDIPTEGYKARFMIMRSFDPEPKKKPAKEGSFDPERFLPPHTYINLIPDTAFKERILTRLGVLDEGEPLISLTQLPEGFEGLPLPHYRRIEPGLDFGSACGLQTNIPGVEAQVHFLKDPHESSIDILVAPAVLERIVQ